jgi:hypothetical protein
MPKIAPYGYARTVINVTVPFTTYLSQVAAQVSLILSKNLGFKAELEKVEIAATTVGTGAGASRLINVRKGGITGTVVGSVTATLANQTTLGTVTAGTVVTAAAANKFNDDGTAPDLITVEFPAAGTVFTAGGLELMLTFRHRLQKDA